MHWPLRCPGPATAGAAAWKESQRQHIRVLLPPQQPAHARSCLEPPHDAGGMLRVLRSGGLSRVADRLRSLAERLQVLPALAS
jgi:hypothetical protein